MYRYQIMICVFLFSGLSNIYAEVKSQIPPYQQRNWHACTCNCENKIIYKNDKITYLSLTTWSKEAAIAAFTYGFGNYEAALKNASQYFTQQGWGEFAEALDHSKNLDVVLDKQLIVTAAALDDPQVVNKININGDEGWLIKLPILVTYTSSEKTFEDKLEITLKIIQNKNNDTVQALGIEQFIAIPQVAEVKSVNTYK
jgi:Type-IV b secretion system, inner-membrane complex component